MIGESNLLQPGTILVLLFSAKKPQLLRLNRVSPMGLDDPIPILNCKFCLVQYTFLFTILF